MISKARIKLIKSLQNKKYRKAEGLFLIEGSKNVLELLNSSFDIHSIYGTSSFYSTNKGIMNKFETKFFESDETTLSKIGSLSNNSTALAVAAIPENRELDTVENDFVLMLDSINDPGNLGTILRIADWYGVSKLVVSQNSVDLFNPKTVQASMGSFTRVSVYYTDLISYLENINRKIKIYGTFLDGTDIHNIEKVELPSIIIMGSESHGISMELHTFIDEKITIPRFGNAESLNVAMATGVVFDNFRRLSS